MPHPIVNGLFDRFLPFSVGASSKLIALSVDLPDSKASRPLWSKEFKRLNRGLCRELTLPNRLRQRLIW
jgi:hypothetical protein